MTRTLRLGEALLAMGGLALTRGLFSGTDAQAQQRIVELRGVLDGLDHPADADADADADAVEQVAITLEEHEPNEGYARWAATYDELSNPLIEFEEKHLLPILDALPRGRALDVCCGTGRLLAQLSSRGFDAEGIDGSIEMLLLAARKVVDARVHLGDIADPTSHAIGEASFDLVTCGLALTHYPSLAGPIAGIARVLRPGGMAVLSEPHPFTTFLDMQAFFVDGDGATGFVRNHSHAFGDYLRAFGAAGFSVRACLEPTVTGGTGPLQGIAAQISPKAAEAAYLGMPLVLIWVVERK